MKGRNLMMAAVMTLAPIFLNASATPEGFEKKAKWAAEAFPAPLVKQEDVRREPQVYLLVDTRIPEEFAVSHLPEAINWPGYKKDELPPKVAEAVNRGRDVVFYCSIGYRSGEAAMRAAELLGGTEHLWNLRGGIFQWANEGGPLEGGEKVHGYNSRWEKFLLPEKRADIHSKPD